nr:hypothetical protein GCM10020063_092310 [Dactylosporangium thailandense]
MSRSAKGGFAAPFRRLRFRVFGVLMPSRRSRLDGDMEKAHVQQFEGGLGPQGEGGRSHSSRLETRARTSFPARNRRHRLGVRASDRERLQIEVDFGAFRSGPVVGTAGQPGRVRREGHGWAPGPGRDVGVAQAGSGGSGQPASSGPYAGAGGSA